MIELIGRLHPLIVHLPIGVFVLVFIFQYLLPVRNGRKELVGVMLVASLIFSILASLMGWVLSWSSDYGEVAVDKHKWPAIFFTVASAGLIPLQRKATALPSINKIYHGLFMCSMGLLLLAGHRGASLTHGGDFLTGSTIKKVKASRSDTATKQDLPKPVQLPDVKAPDSLALVALVNAGFHVGPVALGSHLLEITAINMPALKDEDLNLLKPIAENILWLHLGDRGITDKGVAIISACKNLRRLDLRHTKITDAAAAEISKLSSLEYLNIVGTQLTDEGLAGLKQMKQLKALYCWETKVSAAAIDAFIKASPATRVYLGVD